MATPQEWAQEQLGGGATNPAANTGAGGGYGYPDGVLDWNNVEGFNEFQNSAAWASQLDRYNQDYNFNRNLVDYNDPSGSRSYSQEMVQNARGEWVPRTTENVTLNPTLQAGKESMDRTMLGRGQLGEQMLANAGQTLGSPIDTSGYQDWGNVPGAYQLDSATLNPNLDYSGASALSDPSRFRSYDFSSLGDFEDPTDLRNRVEGEYYDKAASRLDPRWEQQTKDFEASMRAQGLQPGDRQWDQRKAEFDNSRNDAYGGAQFDATRAGGAEFDRASGLDLARRGMLANELRGGVDSYNRAAEGTFGESAQRRGIETGEIGDIWSGFNQSQLAQSGDNRATAGMNFGQQAQQSQYANSLRNQQLAMDLSERGVSINEINALLSGQQVQMPGQSTAGAGNAVGAPNLLAADYYNTQENRLQNAQPYLNAGAVTQGLGELGGMVPWGDVWDWGKDKLGGIFGNDAPAPNGGGGGGGGGNETPWWEREVDWTGDEDYGYLG